MAHPNPERGVERTGRVVGAAGLAGVGLVWFMLAICVVAPIVGVVGGAMRSGGGLELADLAISPARLGWLGRSALYAGLIGLVALVLAWPVALAVSRARGVWLAVVATPMLLPSYLAYAGWSIARAPTTAVGRWIAEAPEHGLGWVPIAASRGLAVWGLALWAWPLAAVVMAAGIGAVQGQVGESLRLERAGAWRRTRTLAGAVWPSIAAAWGLVVLLMLGSAVPLHVARVETYAIGIWMTLDEHPGEPWRAWAAAWPLVLLAVVVGWVLSARLALAGRRLAALGEGERVGRGPNWIGLAAASVPWILAVVVPFGLFWSSMGGVGAIGRLVDRAGVGLATSAAVGSAVGVLAILLTVASAHAASVTRGRAIRAGLGLALAWALLPGVLVGSAIAGLASLGPGWLEDGVAPMIAAHLSRWAFLPMLVGVWVGSSEAGGIADARLVDGAVGIGPWARTSLRSVLGPGLAAGVACFCLSFHEIESSVRVQPPGIDHMAQRLLQWLHYERMGELSAAGVLLLGVGIAGSALVVGATWIAGRRNKTRTRGQTGR